MASVETRDLKKTKQQLLKKDFVETLTTLHTCRKP